MILDNTLRDVKTEGLGETRKMNISTGVEAHIIKLVTEYGYKDELGSVIRESVSNSIDSHKAVEQTLPVVVSLKKNELGLSEFSTEDFGLGLDDVEFDKYIMGIGESSKRDNDDFLGGYGIGSKNFLAYTNSATFICRKNGVERKYLVFKGQELPESTLLYEKETSECNGVKFSMNLNDDYYERRNCIDKIKEQLAYLPNIYFDIEGIDNKYKIFKNELFVWNELQSSQELHICLKGIYYPIDWQSLGISTIYFPVALNFNNYEHLQPTFNREEIKMDVSSKEIILNKIKEVAVWFVEKYNKSVENITQEKLLKDWNAINPKISKKVIIEEKNFNISPLIEYSALETNEPKIEGIFNLKSGIIFNALKYLKKYSNIARIDSTGKMKTRGISQNVWYSNILETKHIIVDKLPVGLQREFLKDTMSNVIFIKLIKKMKLKDVYHEHDYIDILELKNVPKEKWRVSIQEYQSLLNLILSKCDRIEDYPITQKWLDARKAARASRTVGKKGTAKEEIHLTQFKRGCSWENAYKVNLGLKLVTSLTSYHSLNIYHVKGESMDEFEKLVDLHNVALFLVSETNAKKIEKANYHSWISFEEFKKGKTNKFKKLCIQAKAEVLVRKLEKRYSLLHRKLDGEIAHLINQIEYFSGTTHVPYFMMEIAKENKYWNHPITKITMKILKRKLPVDINFQKQIDISTEEGLRLGIEVYLKRLKEHV